MISAWPQVYKQILTEQNCSYLCKTRKVPIALIDLIVPTFVAKVIKYLCSGWIFFSSDYFDFLTSHFWQNFFISFKRYNCPELKIEKSIFHLWSVLVKLWGFNNCHFGQFGTINARYISRYYCVSGELIRLKNRSKLVKEDTHDIRYHNKITKNLRIENKAVSRSKKKQSVGWNQRNGKTFAAQISNINELANHLAFKMKLKLQNSLDYNWTWKKFPINQN